MAAIADRPRRIKTLSPEEGRKLLDEQARRYFDVSGDDFLRDWDAGKYRDRQEDADVASVASLIPFARPPQALPITPPTRIAVLSARFRAFLRRMAD